jgi:adenine-specific DNA-methyltransferase
LADQLDAYEHRGGWVNRLILGDSLVVMNSLLEYEGLGGEIQMIYIDPPYGVKFGSNFQPFVRKRDVKDASDDDLTREPEMVKAYRDTWELGLHSYLTYLRDRLLVARELLSSSGSVFVQISSENVHHVRELMDEVFGSENFVTSISFVKANAQTGLLLESNDDYLIWYARDRKRTKYRTPLLPKSELKGGGAAYRFVELADGTRRPMTKEERAAPELLPEGSRVFRGDKLMSSHPPGSFPVEFEGRTWLPKRGYWSTGEAGMERLKAANRLIGLGDTLSYVRYLDDFPAFPIGSQWSDTITSGFASEKLYAVQTNTKVVQRCMLMTTDPGDLVIDPTCGSGTTAYVAELWGRRWITIDTSRVPLALTRQRLLTATFAYYELQAPDRGPAGGFVYRARKNRKGEHVGGIIPHVTLRSITNDELPPEEIVVDRPEVVKKVTRVTGPFAVEATIPTPMDVSGAESEDGSPDASFIDRMLETLRRNPSLQLGGNKAITLSNVRAPAQSLAISAEAELDDEGTRAAILLGPENGAVGEQLVYEAASEAHLKQYTNLIVIGFAIEPNARALIDKAEALIGIPGTYVQATPDLVMGDLLKTMRSSQLFSVAGLPDVVVRKVALETKDGEQRYEVELLGLDTFDPTTFEAQHRDGSDVPAWFLDTAWNGLSFHVSQAFFPRTSAWEGLRKALKGEFDDSVWDHLAGTVSAPFTAVNGREIAVKVIDDRGNELVVTKSLDEAT